ncbi:ADPRM diphosphatase, partial [Sakesphorus luctuosus]|nr:ADPRM diphosphatase [Sakesphorus luctuosus]
AFGVIADIQFADAEDGHDFGGTRRRYYRHSLRLLRDAVREWAAERPPVGFVLQLGDSIDGLNARRGEAEAALRQVLEALAALPVPVHHAWGNHELYNFSRAQLARSGLCSRPAGGSAGPPDPLCHAYHCSPAAGLRLVVLDAYDLSPLGREPGSALREEALRLLRDKNHNEDLNSPAGLNEPHFVAFNGGFSQAQLDWFNDVLKFSDENQEKVIVM